MIFFSEAKACCRAITASCLACSKGKTIAEYCELEEAKDVVGCKGTCVNSYPKVHTHYSIIIVKQQFALNINTTQLLIFMVL